MKRVIILGSTGSIGRSTLDVIRTRRDLFQVAGLSAHGRIDDLLRQADEFGVESLAVSGENVSVPDRIGYRGEAGLISMIEETSADIVVNGIAGSKGLLPSLAAIRSGKHLALANKETIVMAGVLVRALAARNNVQILPVDSEHSGVFHLLRNNGGNRVEEIILTASGGAFRDLPVEALEHVRLEDALSHPTWNMGPKITIDSATMANKGLEVIEAKGLFDMETSRIRVLIHPQSCVHALVRTLDGSLYAQLSRPDMRVPIQNALVYPDLVPCPFGRLDLEGVVLEFRKPDFQKYPMLEIAYGVAERGGSLPLVYNASNETAVAAFMERKIRYTDIPRVVGSTLELSWPGSLDTIEQVFHLDGVSRDASRRIIETLCT